MTSKQSSITLPKMTMTHAEIGRGDLKRSFLAVDDLVAWLWKCAAHPSQPSDAAEAFRRLAADLESGGSESNQDSESA